MTPRCQMLKERPILFSSPMVRAVLSGQKTQTRRVVAPRSKAWKDIDLARIEGWSCLTPGLWEAKFSDQRAQAILCPYGVVGDRLWVRETWRAEGDKPLSECVDTSDIMFAASIDEFDRGIFKFRPSIFMPRWASRITLEVVSVKIERLQDISEKDAIAEGVEPYCCGNWQKCFSCKSKGVCQFDGLYTSYGDGEDGHPASAIESYQALWNSINGKAHP